MEVGGNRRFAQARKHLLDRWCALFAPVCVTPHATRLGRSPFILQHIHGHNLDALKMALSRRYRPRRFIVHATSMWANLMLR